MVEPTKFRRAGVGASGRRIACGCVGEQFSASRRASGVSFNKTATDERGSGGVDVVAVANRDGASGARIVAMA